jgi:hypothetical protein
MNAFFEKLFPTTLLFVSGVLLVSCGRSDRSPAVDASMQAEFARADANGGIGVLNDRYIIVDTSKAHNSGVTEVYRSFVFSNAHKSDSRLMGGRIRFERVAEDGTVDLIINTDSDHKVRGKVGQSPKYDDGTEFSMMVIGFTDYVKQTAEFKVLCYTTAPRE